MIALGLDTTGGHCTAALVDFERVHTEISENIGRGHAERLTPLVQEVLTKSGIKNEDIGKIGVCTGPGSFTGLRVGLAFAKGFALPRKIPVIGISALEILATQSQAERVLSVMDVRRGEICWALYEKGTAVRPPLTQSVETALAEIRALSYDDIVGDGCHFFSKTSQHTHVSGSVLARLALSYTVKTHPPVPLYSRAPDAKLPGGITPT